MCQALETVVEAAGMINDERVLFVLLGDGARKQALRDAAAAKGVTNILFVDTVSKSEVPAFWSVLDVSLTHLQCTPLFQTVIPSKLFESMGMGIPILHGVDGESAEIVRDCGIGEVFRSEDSRDLADRVMRLANAPEALQSFRENCAKSAKQFDRSELALRMLRVLEETVAMRQVQSSSSGRLP
jgi:glycosyltransferase involved in cell wall biosynthesis